MAVGSGIALVVVALVLLQVRKLLRGLNEQLKPATDRARVVAENLEYVSAVIREDVRKVNDTVSTITAGLSDASDRVEERVQEFHALMEVVQGEAEAVFLDTAAAVRGVRASARTLGGDRSQDGGATRPEALEEPDEPSGLTPPAAKEADLDGPLVTEEADTP